MSRFGKPSDVSKQQRELRATTAERLEAVVEAAERAAASVIDDAERQARQYLTQAHAEADRLADDRISGLAETIDSLLAQASSLRQEAERLQANLEAAKARIDVEIDGERPLAPAEPSSADQEPAPLLRAVESEEAPAGQLAPQPDGKRSNAAGARLLATQMAVGGSSREEIEERLRNGFGIEDTAAVLDAILGPEEQSHA